MNKKLAVILAFGAGAAAGFFASLQYNKNKYKKIADEEIAEVKARYLQEYGESEVEVTVETVTEDKEKTIKYPSNIHFNELQIPFRAVATNLLNGESEILEFGDIAEVIRASMSIPGIFTPAKIGDKFYIDGGVTNNLPIEAAIDFGCDIIIAVEISDDLETEITAFDSNYFVAVA